MIITQNGGGLTVAQWPSSRCPVKVVLCSPVTDIALYKLATVAQQCCCHMLRRFLPLALQDGNLKAVISCSFPGRSQKL